MTKVYLLYGQSCYHDRTVEGAFSTEGAALAEKRRLEEADDYADQCYDHRPEFEVVPMVLRDT